VSIARLRWLYGLQGAALGLLLPFLVPLLAGRGLTATEIGLVLGASGIVTLASYPMWGALADGRLGRPGALVASAAVAVVGGLWLAVAGSDPIVLTAAVSVALVGAMPWGPISDAIALQSLGDRSSSYGRLRAWASVGWAATAIAVGLAWERVGGSAMPVAFGLFAITVALSVLVPGGVRLAKARRAADPRATEEAAAAGADVVRPAAVRREWRLVLASPILLGFLAGLLIVAISEHATWRYVSLRILDQGGSAFLVGLAAALPALVETPVFLGSRRWERILGLRWMYVVGALISSVMALLMGLATEAWMVALFRTFDGTAYALRYIGVVLIIGALLPMRLQAFGQSIGWLVAAGIAPIIADIGGGWIYDAVGGSAVFVASAVLGALGAIVVFLALAGAGLGRRVPVASHERTDGGAARVVGEP
jgi:PPP family 3-phenylpropionic acid transporter